MYAIIIGVLFIPFSYYFISLISSRLDVFRLRKQMLSDGLIKDSIINKFQIGFGLILWFFPLIKFVDVNHIQHQLFCKKSNNFLKNYYIVLLILSIGFIFKYNVCL